MLESHRGAVLFALGIAIAVVNAVALPTRGHGSQQKPAWPMIGHDVKDTRSQPFESRIGPRNAARLAPKWVRGTVYWGSGYARTGGVGNNKFYAFSIGGR